MMSEKQDQSTGPAEKKKEVVSPSSSPRKSDSVNTTPRKQQIEESPPSSPESKNAPKKSIAQLIDNAIKSRKADTLTTRLITDKAGLESCVEALKKESVIAVDSEGINLSRDGELCVLQIASHSSIYLIDVVTLSKEKCWKSECVPQLNSLLSSNDILKLLYDCRNDSDALWHQHQIKLNFVLDLQLLEIARRRQEKLQVTRRMRLVHAIEYRFKHSEDNIQRMRELDSSVRPQFEKFDTLKNEGKAKHEDHPWVHRPMSKDLLGYAASGVVWLLDLAFLHVSALRKQKGGWIGRVMNASTDALLAFRDSPKMIERTSDLAKAPHI